MEEGVKSIVESFVPSVCKGECGVEEKGTCGWLCGCKKAGTTVLDV